MQVFADIRSRLRAIQPVLAALGLLEGARREGSGWKVRCPVHAERTPSCSVTTGPDGTIRVHCHGCSWSGDVLHLVSAARGYDPRRIFRPALEEAARLAGVDLEERPAPGGGARPAPSTPRPTPAAPRFATAPVVRIPRDELAALWRACRSPNVTDVDTLPSDAAAEAFMESRGWWPAQLARIKVCRLLPPPELEHAWPTWWPAAWAKSWRLAVLAYEPDGTAAAIHARSIDGTTPKTRWPRGNPGGYSFGGLLFADVAGRALLAGKPRSDLAGVVIAEGITDFLSWAVDVVATGKPYAVLGGTSGSFPALSQVAPRWPAGVPAIAAVDSDAAGERYLHEITTALAGVEVRRWRPPSSPQAAA